MKGILIILFLFLAFFEPFGGKVISTILPGVSCTGEGPITIRPVGLFPPTFYAVGPATRRYSHFFISPGSWLLGLYGRVPNPVDAFCFTDTVPPAPFSVFPERIFGSSLPSLGL